MNEMTRKATRAMRPSTAHGWGRSAVPKFLTEILGASVRKEWFRFLVLRQPQEGSCITRRNGSESFQNNGGKDISQWFVYDPRSSLDWPR